MEDRETISGPVTGHTFLFLDFPLCKMGIGPFIGCHGAELTHM